MLAIKVHPDVARSRKCWRRHQRCSTFARGSSLPNLPDFYHSGDFALSTRSDRLPRRTGNLLRKAPTWRTCGAGWRVRTTFLGAVRSPWGLSLSRLVGFGIWLPPTYVGARDHRPTAVSAPRFSFMLFRIGDIALCPRATPIRRRRLRREALARRRAVAPGARAAFGRRLADEGLRLARLWRPRTVSAFHSLRDEPDTLELLTALAGEGFATALPVVVGRGRRSFFGCGGRATRPAQARCRLPSRSKRRPRSNRISCSFRSPASTATAIGSATAPAITTAPSPACVAIKPVHAVGVAYGVCEVAAVPYEAHDQSLDAIVTEQETILFRDR